MFLAILFFDPKWWFCQIYRLCMEAIFANIQNALISRILVVFKSGFFCIEQLYCGCRYVFYMFLAILFFDPKWWFCQVYSPCMEAIFGNIQNALISRILVVFKSGFFCMEQLYCVCRYVFYMFLAILFFDPKWWFCKVYSLCMEAIFANIQNALISRILVVF